MLMTFFIVMFILLMQFLWKYIDDLVGKGLEPHIILELLLYASAGLMPMALPLATLLSSLMTMGNLGEHNELLAMKSSGISLPGIMMPLFVVSLLVTGFAFFSADRIVPVATLKTRTLIRSVQTTNPELIIRPGVFYSNLSGYSLRVGSRSKKTNLMRDITIYDHTAGAGNVSVSRADSGYITVTPNQKYMILELYSGIIYSEDDREVFQSEAPLYTSRVTHFAKERLVKELKGFGFTRASEERYRKSYYVMNTSQLSRVADSMNRELDTIERSKFLNFQAENFLLAASKADSIGEGRSFDFASAWGGLDSTAKSSRLAMASERAQALKSSMYEYAQDVRYRRERIARFDIEYLRKFTLSIACLLFMLIGAPLGAIIRKGGLGLPVIISVLFFVVYYVLSITGEKLVRQLLLSPEEGMWASTLILLPIAVFLTYKATTDSVLLNAEWYAKRFSWLVRLISSLKKSVLRGQPKGK